MYYDEYRPESHRHVQVEEYLILDDGGIFIFARDESQSKSVSASLSKENARNLAREIPAIVGEDQAEGTPEPEAPAFKVGDRVRLVTEGKYNLNERATYTHEAPNGIGSLGTVTGYGARAERLEVKWDGKAGRSYFLPSCFELVIEPRFKVGDRVRLVSTAGGSHSSNQIGDLATVRQVEKSNDPEFDLFLMLDFDKGQRYGLFDARIEHYTPDPVGDVLDAEVYVTGDSAALGHLFDAGTRVAIRADRYEDEGAYDCRDASGAQWFVAAQDLTVHAPKLCFDCEGCER